MAALEETPRATIQLSRGALIATIQVDLGDAVLERLRQDLLQRIRVTSAEGAVLDLSGVEIMDASDFAAIRRTVSMASLMGTVCVLAGLRPGVASALVDLGCDCGGLHTALNLDAALAELQRLRIAGLSGESQDGSDDGDVGDPTTDHE